VFIQPKLIVGAVNDPLEHEADRVADQVIRMAGPNLSTMSAPPQVSLKCAAEATEARRELPSGVHSAIARERGRGQPLDERTRHRMEDALAHDFSQVRVHADPTAGDLSRAVVANAFASGSDIFFAPGVYRPDSQDGRRLLAHELTHVIQQGGATPSRLMCGAPADRFEREADIMAGRVSPASGHLHGLGPDTFSHGGSVAARLPVAANASTGLVQRDPDKEKKKAPTSAKPVPAPASGAGPVRTWAGEFSAPQFDVGTFGTGKSGTTYGAVITISFMPYKSVDAESIALVQTAQAANSSIPSQVDPLDEVPVPDMVVGDKARDVWKSRLVDNINRGLGRHVDQAPESRTPLALATVDPKSTDLAKSVPHPDFTSHGQPIHTQFGFRTDKKGAQAAQTGDVPTMTVPDDASASQSFETAALAIDGVQRGSYYGSVKWGWRKPADKTAPDAPDPIPFERSKDAAPSPDFFAAAEAWNASKNTLDQPSIALPTSSNKVLGARGDLMDGPDKKAKLLAKLDQGTKVAVFEGAGSKEWAKVIVTDARQQGRIGWIKTTQLTDPPSDLIIPKKKKKT
jgi:hypothetical protein